MTELVPGLINDRWQLMLTPDREEFHRLRPEWEAERLASCYELMRPGDMVWDLGAESGDFTALYKQWVGPSGRVVPVEPSPPMWPQLRTHWEGNDCGPCPSHFVGFVSDVDDWYPRNLDVDTHGVGDDGWPLCSVGEVVPDPGFRHLNPHRDRYRQSTIDRLVTAFGAPDCIVMDIEGAEWHALSGATEMLRDARPLVWVSIHPLTLDEWYGKAPVDIHLLMRDAGYVGEFLGLCTEELWLYRPRELAASRP